MTGKYFVVIPAEKQGVMAEVRGPYLSEREAREAAGSIVVTQFEAALVTKCLVSYTRSFETDDPQPMPEK